MDGMLAYWLLSLFLECATMIEMKRRRKFPSHPISWLPIDSRLIAPLFSFGHVRGVARFFLEVEIVLSLLVVIGTLSIVIVRFFLK